MIRTVEQYMESLNDGREIWCLGEKVKDVRTHPILRTIVMASATDFVIPRLPQYKDLFVTKDADGEEINFMNTAPRTVEDMVRRRECYMTGCRQGGIVLHCMGVDALAAATVAAAKMDANLGTDYSKRVENYRKYLQKNDIGITGAITDVKGDRGLRASKQVQHKDFYTRVVERKKDGIIVRGAKVHISSTPGANEAIILPCRAHASEDEKDYALVFATPLNAKGIKLLAVEPNNRTYGEEAHFDYPKSASLGPTECLIVFDDVFVPWERVFMCGEYQYSRDVTFAFATFHRLFGSTRMSAELETLVGSAALMAEYNGLEKYDHIKDKLAWLAMYAETVNAVSKLAAIECQQELADLMVPNIMYANIAKFTFAQNFHEAVKTVQDVAGGIPATVPCYKDWQNKDLRPYIEKYLGGKAGIPTEDRIKASRLVKDFTGSYWAIANLHGEGSLAQQKMFLYWMADWKRFKAAAKREANISGWEDDPTYGFVHDPRETIEKKMPPMDTSYKL